jgi:hypothetical protein
MGQVGPAGVVYIHAHRRGVRPPLLRSLQARHARNTLAHNLTHIDTTAGHRMRLPGRAKLPSLLAASFLVLPRPSGAFRAATLRIKARCTPLSTLIHTRHPEKRLPRGLRRRSVAFALLYSTHTMIWAEILTSSNFNHE